SQVIELLADRWIEAHPEFERVQHQHGHRHDEDEAPADAVAEAVEELTHAGAGVEGEDEA
ncbi:MAG: hypothetical protein R6W31_05145, partial [Bacteroidales bacterium]